MATLDLALHTAYQGTAPVERWRYATATNGCLNVLAQRRRRGLPQLEREPAGNEYQFGETEAERWVTPASDERLFPDASEVAEAGRRHQSLKPHRDSRSQVSNASGLTGLLKK